MLKDVTQSDRWEIGEINVAKGAITSWGFHARRSQNVEKDDGLILDDLFERYVLNLRIFN